MKTRNFENIKEGTLLLVSWMDIIDKSSWTSDAEAQTMQPMLCKNIGWFVNSDKDSIRLTHSVAEDGEKSIFVLPKGCIKKIQKIKYGRQK